jgi:hypothetical protein
MSTAVIGSVTDLLFHRFHHDCSNCISFCSYSQSVLMDHFTDSSTLLLRGHENGDADADKLLRTHLQKVIDIKVSYMIRGTLNGLAAR